MRKKIVFWSIFSVLWLILLGATCLFGLDAMVRTTTGEYILSVENAADLQGVDCILVLGCGVHDDGSPSDMLHDRLRRSMELYENGTSTKLLMSGDHGRKGYDEVDTMKSFAVEAGVSSSNVFMDHAGFSTYESMYRAKEIFGVRKVVIVSQEYHLYRAIYIARQLGIEAYGVSSNYRNYRGQAAMDLRETFARVKDVFNCMLLTEPTYLGETIPISGDGNLTNDENSNFN
jgi:vancomycin permeability regulator SanA